VTTSLDVARVFVVFYPRRHDASANWPPCRCCHSLTVNKFYFSFVYSTTRWRVCACVCCFRTQRFIHLSLIIIVILHTCIVFVLHMFVNFMCTITGTSSRLGDRAFAAAGPRLWNSLPTHVRRLDLSSDTFRHKLKSYLTVRGSSTFAFVRCVQIFLHGFLHFTH